MTTRMRLAAYLDGLVHEAREGEPMLTAHGRAVANMTHDQHSSETAQSMADELLHALGLTVAPVPRKVQAERLAAALAGITDDEPGKVARRMRRICYDKARLASLLPVAEMLLGSDLTVAPPPGEDAKDAEIARLRGENEKLRGVRVALADLQVSVEVRDQLAAIEREVREAHAEEIASLRAEVARLRQPPPSPSREEAVERLTNMLLHAFAHGARAFWEERNRELVRENDVLRSNSDHLSSENASLSRQVESMAMRIESLAEELAKPEDVRLREVLDALEGRAVIFDGLGARVGHLLDEMDEWIGRAGEAERAVEAAQRRLACVADDMTEHAYQEMTYDKMRQDCERMREAEKNRIVDEWKAANGYNDLLAAYSASVSEADRLRKLFDDAGQGEHNVLALIDHYQRNSMEADERIRAVRKLLEENGCDCPCDHHPDERGDDCEVCLACRIGEAVGK